MLIDENKYNKVITNMCSRALFFLFCSFYSPLALPSNLSELSSQPNKNIELKQNALIQGFQKTRTVLKFVDARIHITYINDKATLANSSDWNKVYSIPIGPNKIRYISDTQAAFFTGEISFEAKPGQRYQIKNNQSDRNSLKNGIHFWIENVDTGEVIDSQQSAKTLGSGNQNGPSSPIIIQK